MRYRNYTFIIIFLLSIMQTNSSADDRWNQYVKNDINQFKQQVNFQTALIAGGWLTGMYLLSAFDEDLNHKVKPLYSGSWKSYFNTIDYLGYVPYNLPVSIGITALTMIGNDKKLQDAAFTSLQASITSIIFVGATKLILGRTRPDTENGPRNFLPFTDFNSSFPSGHTATAFALVTPWIYYYPHPLTYLLLVFPASTAVSRMVLNRHWFTDVLTGAVLGSVIGITLAKWHKELASERGFYDPLETPPKLVSFTIQL